MCAGPRLLTKTELQEQARARGAEYSISQIDYVRQRGLIGFASHTPKNGRGSASLYLQEMVERLVLIRELSNGRIDFDLMGWKLWLRGYEVADVYWLPKLAAAARHMRFLASACVVLFDKREVDDAFADRWSDGSVSLKRLPSALRKPFSNVRRSLPDNPAWTVLWIIIEAIARQLDCRTAPGLQRTFLALAGAQRSESDRVLGQRFEAGDALPEFLDALGSLRSAPTPSILLSPENRTQLFAARDDVRHTMEACDEFHSAVRWFYGNDAFGLRCAAWLSRNASPDFQAHMIVFWMAIRGHPMFPSSDVIADLASKAKASHQMSVTLRKEIESDPWLAATITTNRVKEAFSSLGGPEKLGKEIEQIRRKCCIIPGLENRDYGGRTGSISD